ncbi:MAG: DnaJ domain-containing protein [Planctomycetes bacterium]|nr:DnaJ domain-containing protein [Planctomycetota bacterium]
MRTAYRKLVLQWHPDKNRSKEAPTRFKEIQKAFELLYRRAGRGGR